jgi:hypothetical protein
LNLKGQKLYTQVRVWPDRLVSVLIKITCSG